jgi:hypothetical protein
MKLPQYALAIFWVLLVAGVALTIVGVSLLANRTPIVSCPSGATAEATSICVATANIALTVAGLVMACVGAIFILIKFKENHYIFAPGF